MVFASDRPQGDRVECIQSMSKFPPGGIASALLRQRLTTHRLLERVRGKSWEVNNHICFCCLMVVGTMRPETAWTSEWICECVGCHTEKGTVAT